MVRAYYLTSNRLGYTLHFVYPRRLDLHTMNPSFVASTELSPFTLFMALLHPSIEAEYNLM